METNSMQLKILLPFKSFLDIKNVKNIVAETSEGSYGFLPQRLDCVAALVPGIFCYETDEMHYLAIDEGVMVKTGTQVLVSVRNAIGGKDLGELQESVEKEFLNIDEQEINVRSVMAKLESGLIQRMEKLSKY
ncbi:MAG: F0F1 ATP synthase subunit epsilon [bacterium]|nr:F0F1 ATP synthase subunit epsilon [bacterium]